MLLLKPYTSLFIKVSIVINVHLSKENFGVWVILLIPHMIISIIDGDFVNLEIFLVQKKQCNKMYYCKNRNDIIRPTRRHTKYSKDR